MILAMSHTTKYRTLQDVLDDEPTAFELDQRRKSTSPMEDRDFLVALVVQLANDKSKIADIAMNLSLIAPKRYLNADGTTFIWRCPDDLVPDV